MPFARSLPASLLLSMSLGVTMMLGCHAQQPQQPSAQQTAAAAAGAALSTGTPLSPDLQRKVEVMLREKANLPPETTVQVGGASPSEFAGFDKLSVVVTNSGRVSKPIDFLLSKDRKTLAQISKFDISNDPKNIVSAEGRPFRGGPASAPVTIVGFDDLECPYCGRLHTEIFPSLIQRYGDKVHFVYKDFPLDEIHPWAMRAAVDTNCLGAQSNDGYWSEVDYIHSHGDEFGKDPKDPKAEKTLARASEQIDTITREQAQSRKADMTKLNACIAKQDASSVTASHRVGEELGVNSTPTLYINGDKIDGAVSLEFLYGIIDQALRVAGVQPPPPYAAPAPAAPAPGTPAAGSSGAPTGR